MDSKANDRQHQYTEGQDGSNDNEDIVTRLQVKVDGIWVCSSVAKDGRGDVSQVRGTNCTGGSIKEFPCVDSECSTCIYVSRVTAMGLTPTQYCQGMPTDFTWVHRKACIVACPRGHNSRDYIIGIQS